jgi:hypothetical protein
VPPSLPAAHLYLRGRPLDGEHPALDDGCEPLAAGLGRLDEAVVLCGTLRCMSAVDGCSVQDRSTTEETRQSSAAAMRRCVSDSHRCAAPRQEVPCSVPAASPRLRGRTEPGLPCMRGPAGGRRAVLAGARRWRRVGPGEKPSVAHLTQLNSRDGDVRSHPRDCCRGGALSVLFAGKVGTVDSCSGCGEDR